MKPDMSPEAVTARLKKTSELRRLCISLGGERLQKKMWAQMKRFDISRSPIHRPNEGEGFDEVV